MPGQGRKIPQDIADMMAREMTKKIDKQFTDVLTGGVSIDPPNMRINDPTEIWKPESYEYKKLQETERRKFKDAIMQDWNEIRKQDPDEQFRRQVTNDIAQIKDAIRKIGILFDEDAPSHVTAKKRKMLKDAYKKYKMIEALVLEDGV